MVNLTKPSYGPYERQRLFRILLDLTQSRRDLNWSSMADAIYSWRKVYFQRNNFYRLKKGTLRDDNVEIIVAWVEKNIDAEIRSRLKPQAIFDEVGKSIRDYYFHISVSNVLDEWDEQILEEYAGVYLCNPANDKNSYLPLTILRQWYENNQALPYLEKKSRTLDIKQYIQERAILILQRTASYYFYAAEFPLSAFFPRFFETLDVKMTYEGVGIISSNSIHVQLRECLSRVPKIHSILISQKNPNQTNNPFGLSLYLPQGTESVRKEWGQLAREDIDHLKREYALSIAADTYLAGPVQISVSPVPYLRNHVTVNFSRDYVYHRKPADFLKDKALHFIRPDLENTEQVNKIVDNPLSIGELL